MNSTMRNNRLRCSGVTRRRAPDTSNDIAQRDELEKGHHDACKKYQYRKRPRTLLSEEITPLMMVSSSSLKNVCVCMTGNKFAGMYSMAALTTKAAVVARLLGLRACSGAWHRGHLELCMPIDRTVARHRVQTSSPRLRPVTQTSHPRLRRPTARIARSGVALVSALNVSIDRPYASSATRGSPRQAPKASPAPRARRA